MVHRDYYVAGAGCVTSASYQASYEGFAAAGFSESEATDLLRRSVHLAFEARDWATRNIAASGRLLVAASIGPYGATLHDGSEYRGDYSLSERDLADFHGRRLRVLSEVGPDMLACETIPSLLEARALASLLQTETISAWISFSSPDGLWTSAGDALSDCARALDPIEQVIAVGVNCLDPIHVGGALSELRRGTTKPLLAYPNTGGQWDPGIHAWCGGRDDVRFCDYVAEWVAAGARAIGGCCGTGPRDIQDLARTIAEAWDSPQHCARGSG
jgi:homocysteine S-methyltransferase